MGRLDAEKQNKEKLEKKERRGSVRVSRTVWRCVPLSARRMDTCLLSPDHAEDQAPTHPPTAPHPSRRTVPDLLPPIKRPTHQLNTFTPSRESGRSHKGTILLRRARAQEEPAQQQTNCGLTTSKANTHFHDVITRNYY